MPDNMNIIPNFDALNGEASEEVSEENRSPNRLPSTEKSFSVTMKNQAIEEMNEQQKQIDTGLQTPIDMMRKKYEETPQTYQENDDGTGHRPLSDEEAASMQELVENVEKIDADFTQIRQLIAQAQELQRNPQLATQRQREQAQKIMQGAFSEMQQGDFTQRYSELKREFMEQKEQKGIARSFVEGFIYAHEEIGSFKNYIEKGMDAKSLSPADMLRIQQKMSDVSHSIEYFATVLNKSLEGIKQLFSVQG